MPPQIYPFEPDKLEERGYKSFPNALEKDPLVFFHATAMDARDELPALQRNAKRLHTALQEFWELQAKRDKLQMLEKSELGDLQSQIEWHPAAEQRLEGLKISLTSSASELPDLIVGHTKQVAIRHAT